MTVSLEPGSVTVVVAPPFESVSVTVPVGYGYAAAATVGVRMTTAVAVWPCVIVWFTPFGPVSSGAMYVKLQLGGSRLETVRLSASTTPFAPASAVIAVTKFDDTWPGPSVTTVFEGAVPLRSEACSVLKPTLSKVTPSGYTVPLFEAPVSCTVPSER